MLKRLPPMFTALCLLLVGPLAEAMDEKVVSLPTRPGVEQKFILIKAENPVASVILFAGGKGALQLSNGLFGGVAIDWGRNNFLVRTREQFVQAGFTVAVVDAPTDRYDDDGMYGGFRSSDEHIVDIDVVIAYLREQGELPVWLVGTSRGTNSATHLALYSKQQPHGLVLTASMSESNNKGDAVTEMALSQVKLPVLIASHEDDMCHVTPPEGAEEIKAAMTAAPKVEVKYFSGGDDPVSKACQARSQHGFYGIESEVVAYIADFIKAN